MTALALTGKCGFFGARGPFGTPAAPRGAPTASPKLMPKRPARLMAPKPMPVRARKSRRVKIRSSREGECSRRNFSVRVWSVTGVMAFRWFGFGGEGSEGEMDQCVIVISIVALYQDLANNFQQCVRRRKGE